jgi:hypothetical protein
METELANVRTIHPFNRTKIFGQQEAVDLIPLLVHISAKSKRELNLLNSQLGFVKANSERGIVLQNKIHMNLQAWSDKIRRLGLIPVSPHKVRIPGEDCHFIWEYPDKKLSIH